MRKLKPNEIDLRIGVVSKKSPKASLLLFKDARCDMAILDEVYGAENWQDKYEKIEGVLYCSVGVYNENIKEWVWKSSNGIESQGTGTNDPNNVKGEASDAFKRACFMWGIGRELYDWKGIWIDYNKDTDKYKKFFVTKIGYKDNGEPKDITIVDENGKTMYQMTGGKYKKVKQEPQAKVEPNPNIVTNSQEKVADEPKSDLKNDIIPNEQPALDIPNTIKERNSKIYKNLLERVYRYGLTQQMNETDSKEWAKAVVKNYLTKELKIPFNKMELLNEDELSLDENKTNIIIDDSFMTQLLT